MTPTTEVLNTKSEMAPVDPIPSGSSRINVGENERFLSVGGGALLATIGLRRGGLTGLVLTALGGMLVYRGASGFCAFNQAIGRDTSGKKTETDVLEISKTVVMNKPRADVYQFWRKLENLPLFMRHLQTVTQLDSKRSHWVASLDSDSVLAKALPTIEWDAEIIEEDEDSRLVWRSVPGATIDNSGEVRFVDAPQGGTEVHAVIKYRAPAGVVGETAMKLFSPAFKALVGEDVQRFKRFFETDDMPVNAPPVAYSAESDKPHISRDNVVL